MFSKTDLGTAKLAETNEGVHSDQNEKGQSINLKFKTMKKTIQFAFMMVFVMTTIFFAGCKKEQVKDVESNQQTISNSTKLEDVSKVSLQRLAEMQGDEKVDPSLYENIEKRIASLSKEDYDIFIQEWAKVEINDAISLGVISSNEKQEALNILISNLQKRTKESQRIYNKPFNQISDQQQLKIVEDLELSKGAMGFTQQKSSCPSYYYGYSTTNNGAGLVSNSGWTTATNSVDSDCDYEFIFYPGPIVYNSSTLKTKGTTSRANQVLNSGGINGRVGSDVSFRILVGYGTILLKYPGSVLGNPSAFASEFKFRGLV